MILTRRRVLEIMGTTPFAFTALADHPNSGHMFLSLNGVLLSNRVPWPEFARLAAKVGFPGTDVMREPAIKAGASGTRDLLNELHLRPAVIDFPVEFRKDDGAFKSSLQILDET